MTRSQLLGLGLIMAACSVIPYLDNIAAIPYLMGTLASGALLAMRIP